MSCGVGHRCGLDPELLWLRCRLVAVALIVPLAWELPYATGVALKKKNFWRTKVWDRSSRRGAEVNESD